MPVIQSTRLPFGLVGLGIAGLLAAASSPARAQVPPSSEPAAPQASPTLVPPLPPAPPPAVEGPAPTPAPLPVHTPVPAPTPPVAEAPAPKPDEPAVPLFQAAPGKGLTVTSRDNRFQLNLKPRVQLRAALGQHKHGADELEVNVRTLRLTLAGFVLTPDLKYLIQFAFGGGDFDTGSASPIFDAFVEYTGVRDLNVRVGQFFVPFDRARTIREFALQFVDRQAVVRELTLDRDVGLMFSSADVGGLGGRLAYNVFVGSGDGRNRFLDSKNPYGPQRPGVLAVARLTVRPFGPFDDDQEGDLTRTKTPKLAIGVAGGYNRSSTRQRSTTGDTYTGAAFDYQHAAADAVFKYRGFNVLAETVWRGANKKSIAHLDTTTNKEVMEYSREGWGWFAQASQMLTGKVELATRYETLHNKKGTDPALVKAVAGQAGQQAGGALNIYLNGHQFKLQADYFYVWAQRTRNDYHIARLQLDASF